MKKIILMSALASAMLTSYAAHATGSTALKDSGTINPPPCNVTFVAGDTANYETIVGESLNKTTPTDLGKKSVPLKVDCGGANKRIALKFADNRSGSRVNGLFGEAKNQNFGLGTQMVGGVAKNIGGYRIVMSNNTVNENAASILSGDIAAGGTWAADDEVKQNKWQGFATGTAATPVSGSLFMTNLDVYTRVTKSEDLDMGQPITLDGMATIQVTYL